MLKTSLLGLNGPLSIRSPKSVHTCSTEADQSRIPTSIRRRRSGGFTLLEVLIATAVTMLMMLGLAQIFRVLGESMSQGRAGLELNNRLRSVMHRIRTDLDNVTVTPHPPITVGTAQGYLKYYEGPASDYTFANNSLLSRFGDVDDIFMATVKAKDTWFTGKVPRFVASGRDLEDPALTPAVNGSDFELVTIASQFAEIVIFAQPLVAQGRPVGYTLNDTKPERDASFLASHPDFYERTIIEGVPIEVPSGYRLHYRVLLIRPDLNKTLFGNRIGIPAHPGTGSMIVGQSTLNGVPLQTPQLDMYKIHQDCDLSVRRTGNYVVANNLEDLANPANRFGHVVYNLSNVVVSMPLLALSPALSFQGVGTSIAKTGFLHPAFVLHDDRAGEDVLTTDLLAFDIKGYDSSAPVICFVGADGEPGVRGRDDDNNLIIDRLGGGALDIGELGTTESDDVTLKPGDPGFLVFGLATYPSGSAIIAQGEFVDLNWAGKLDLSVVPSGLRPSLPLKTELSGLRLDTNNQWTPTSSLLRSGSVKLVGNALAIFQTSYDTFTDLYERDGTLQSELGNGRGLVNITTINSSAVPVLHNEDQWRNLASILSIDAGTDGVDNAGSAPGVDDPSERETSPPFPVDLRGLQISVRLEDPTKKQFKQMSTVKQFVTN